MLPAEGGDVRPQPGRPCGARRRGWHRPRGCRAGTVPSRPAEDGATASEGGAAGRARGVALQRTSASTSCALGMSPTCESSAGPVLAVSGPACPSPVPRPRGPAPADGVVYTGRSPCGRGAGGEAAAAAVCGAPGEQHRSARSQLPGAPAVTWAVPVRSVRSASSMFLGRGTRNRPFPQFFFCGQRAFRRLAEGPAQVCKERLCVF